MELENQSVSCSVPNGEMPLNLKDTDALDEESKHLKNINSEKSARSEAGTNLSAKNADMRDSSLSLLDGEYRGLAKQLSIEYVDIFEILKAELLAAEGREFELIENELLNYDISEVDDLKKKNAQDEIKIITYSGLANGDSQGARLENNPLKTDCQAPLIENQPHGENGQVQRSLSSSGDIRGAPATPSSEKDGVHCQGGDGDASQQKDDLNSSKEVETPSLDGAKVEVLQNVEIIPKTGKDVSVEEHDNIDKTATRISLINLISEEHKDAYLRDANDDDKMKMESTGSYNHEDENELSHVDKGFEYSEDDEHTPIPFSGPLPFSGMLSYSGMLSQLPYSGSLSLHSESSTSTRSFAFPVLSADWTSSPAKIGPPDRRYFRSRRRWRPCFCCKRPTTLFD